MLGHHGSNNYILCYDTEYKANKAFCQEFPFRCERYRLEHFVHLESVSLVETGIFSVHFIFMYLELLASHF